MFKTIKEKVFGEPEELELTEEEKQELYMDMIDLNDEIDQLHRESTVISENYSYKSMSKEHAERMTKILSNTIDGLIKERNELLDRMDG